MSLYLILDVLAVSVPLALSFDKKLQFYKRWKYFFPALILGMIPFLVWDHYFTENAFWGFNPAYISGIYIFSLPIEEILFFVVVPYSSIFAYYTFTTYFPGYRLGKVSSNVLTGLLIVGSLIAAILYFHRPYTLINFASFAILLILVQLTSQKILPYFLAIFPVLLIPFFIMNGILTGTGIEHEVVWYSPDVFIGFRLLTIPFEDIFYGFTLILLVLYLFEKIESRAKKL